jgi:hypothetical protein
MKKTLEEGFMLNEILVRNKDTKAPTVAWGLARNRAKLEQPLKDFEEITQPTKAMQEREAAVRNLGRTFAMKGPTGDPIVETVPENPRLNRFRIEDPACFELAYAALIQEHAQAAEDERDLVQRRRELLTQEFEFEPYTIPKAATDGVLSSDDLFTLFKHGIVTE